MHYIFMTSPWKAIIPPHNSYRIVSRIFALHCPLSCLCNSGDKLPLCCIGNKNSLFLIPYSLFLACSPMWSYWPGTMGRWCLSWSRLKWVSSVPCQTTQSLWFLGWSSLCPQKVVCTFCTYSNQLWQHIDLKVKLTGGVQLTRSRYKQHILFSHVT